MTKEGNRISPEERELAAIFGEELEGVLAKPHDYDEERSQVSHVLLKDQVKEVLSTLTTRERRVLNLRFGLEDGRSRTQVEAGKEIGRSRWTVGRIEKRALAKLHAPAQSQQLRDYLS